MSIGVTGDTSITPAASPQAQRSGEDSDGYHTFNELYEHRHALFAIVLHSYHYSAWKTWRDQNGEIWEGWFIAGIDTIHGQISYHLPAEWWERLPNVQEIERNAAYDGHTSADVLKRLRLIIEG